MIACRLRTFAKCQRPKSGDNAEEGWTRMEREPLDIHIHTHTLAYRTQNKLQDVLHSSRHGNAGSHNTHFSLKPYSWCIGSVQCGCVCLLFPRLRLLCLYLSMLTPWSISFPPRFLQTINDWLLFDLSLLDFSTHKHALVDKRPKAPERTAWFCMHISKGTLFAVLVEQNLELTDSACPFCFSWQINLDFQSVILTISRIISDHHLVSYITNPMYVETWESCWNWLQCYRLYIFVLFKSCQCHKVTEVVERYCSLSTVNTSNVHRCFSCRVKGFKWICRYAKQIRIKEMPFISVFKHVTGFLRDFFLSHCAFSF